LSEVVSADNLDQYVTYSAKLNFKTAGKKLGPAAPKVAEYLGKLEVAEIKSFETSKQLKVNLEDQNFSLKKTVMLLKAMAVLWQLF